MLGLILACLVPQVLAQPPLELRVTDTGFEPKSLSATPNEPVTLKITRISDETCSKDIVIPQLKIKQPLPLNRAVTIRLGKLQKGEIKFGCAMHMMDSGLILVK